MSRWIVCALSIGLLSCGDNAGRANGASDGDGASADAGGAARWDAAPSGGWDAAPSDHAPDAASWDAASSDAASWDAAPGYCGDFLCQPELGEDTFTCQNDCEIEFCGNGNCGPGENPGECPLDCCGIFPEECGNGLDDDCNGQTDEVCCGDGICDSANESYGTCIDCGECGDHICDDAYEDVSSCPADCR